MQMDILINVSKFHKDRLKDHVVIVHKIVLKFVRHARCNEVNLGLFRSIVAAAAVCACGVRTVRRTSCLSRYAVRLCMDSRVASIWTTKSKNGNLFLAKLL